MARIRTIKPEFPQSESMGNISRDARLTFILLWTIADDSGRTRGSSRMLASLLFPYDDDAPNHIEGWLLELENEKCIVRYEVDGKHYLQIQNWADNQKIDRPSASKYPSYADSLKAREDSRGLARAREDSSLDQGPRTKEGTKDQGYKTLSLTLLTNKEFAEVWERWQRHRLEKQKPLGEIEAESQLLELSRHAPDDAAAMVEFTIRRGAVNLITNGDHRQENRGPPSGSGSGGGGGRKRRSLEEVLPK